MLETPIRPPAPATASTVHGPRSRLELDLRDFADGLAGRLDRDELSREDEQLVAEAIDAAVAAALPEVVEAMDRELTPRIEALPMPARLTLARARRRLEVGRY